MSSLIGQHLGQYEIVALLGRGGMATVYGARQASMGRDVAIKVIRPDLAEVGDFVARFEREARTVAALGHPHILKVFDYGQRDDLVYLVMDLLKGGSLAELIRQGPLTLDVATRALDQIAAALDYAHKLGIIHRDLKPQNVLLDTEGNAHLTDFGIAKILSEASGLTQSGTALGTPAYMPPEQWQGKPLDARADVYALGIMLFEMLTGRLPFAGDTAATMMYMHLQGSPPAVRAFRPGLPAGIEPLIRKALSKNPERRFASAGDLAAAFRDAVAGKATRRPSALPKADDDAPVTEQLVNAPARFGQATWRLNPRLLIGGLGLTVLIAAASILTGSGRQGQPTVTTNAVASYTKTPTITTMPTIRPTPTNPPLASNVPTVTAITAMPTIGPTPTNPPLASNVPTVAANSQWVPSVSTFDGVAMMLVPPGCFMMGSNQYDDEKNGGKVCFDKPFWIDKTEVTQAQFKHFGGQAAISFTFKGDDLPVENITWFEARDFCAKRGARLPTEAEWEYAARGPDNLVYPWGDTFISDDTVYSGNSNSQTANVGSNPKGVSWIGAYDLSGNVWEWVSTVYKPYPYNAADGREDNTNSPRVLRGGSWNNIYTGNLRAATRGRDVPSLRYFNLGFRCARSF